MSEFGGRSELGRRHETRQESGVRKGGDWSKDLLPASPEVLARRRALAEALEKRPVDNLSMPTPFDLLKETKGESDTAIFSTSPLTKPATKSGVNDDLRMPQSQPVPSVTEQLNKRDWPLDLLMPDGKRAGDSKSPAADLLTE
jgi:hypothetical protein